MKFEVDEVALGEVSRRVLMLSLLSIIIRMLHTLLQLHVAVTRLMYIRYNDANSDYVEHNK